MKRLRAILAAIVLGLLLAIPASTFADGEDDKDATDKKDAKEKADADKKDDKKKDDDKKEKKNEKPDPLAFIDEARTEWEKIDTFQAIFTRRERLEGERKCYEEQVIFVRGRKKPFSIYMHWVGDEFKDREVMYIDGQNDNKFKGRLGGIAGLVTVTREPDSPMVYKYSRHTILEAGIWNLLDRLKRRLTDANKVARTFYKGIHKFNGRDCHKFYRYLPDKKDEDGNNIYYAWRVELWFDVETKLPVVIRMYDWDKKLFEEYTYRDIVKNPPLKDEDFQLGSHKE